MSKVTIVQGWKEKLARILSDALSAQCVVGESEHELVAIETLVRLLERPRTSAHGDFALPLFPFSKALKIPPPKIYESISERLTTGATWYDHSLVGAYINFRLHTDELSQVVLREVADSSPFGGAVTSETDPILVEFSSPNIAKPFGIGHLRSTILGASLARIFARLGHPVVRINYLGDWGTQFGKMIVAYRRWDGEAALAADPVRGAYNLYVRFHEEEDKDPTLAEEARAAFRALEEGEAEALRLWRMFKDVSWREFERVYEILGVEFDLVTGESFLNDRMDAVIARLSTAGLTTMSRGALIVDLEEHGLPSCLLRKQDGGTLYATRDITGAFYRWEIYHYLQSLYIVGAAQADHFKQCFTVVDMLERAEGVSRENRIASRLRHVPFGWVKFEDKALSTRRGNLIFLEEVLTKAIALAKERITEKNPDLPDSDRVARQIGVGAVMFTQLSVRKQKDVNFTWEHSLSFEGETGPYLQYTHARLSSLLRKAPALSLLHTETDIRHCDNPETHQLLFSIAHFPDVVRQAADECEPFLIAEYLLSVASLFNSYYQRKDADGRIVKIISEDAVATSARLMIVRATRVTIAEGLTLLGIAAPEEM